jgi:hypothetical protein
MHRLLCSISFAVLAFMPVAVGLAPSVEASDCQPRALERLRASAPDGFAVYQHMKDKKFFLNWISCDDAQFDLSTAVHESVHYLTEEMDAFPLINGGEIKRPHEVSAFFAPSLIAGKFNAKSEFVSTYLRPGRASSSADFIYLLDELNAYTHDLNAAIDLAGRDIPKERPDEVVAHRDGLAALMSFVALYVERAEQSEPETWSGLRQPRVAKTVSELWGHAEKVMAASCGIPYFGADDKASIRQFCAAGPESALRKIIGRAPVCPTACLKAGPETAQASEPDIDETPTGSLRGKPAASPARPFWSRAVKRRLAPSSDLETDEDMAD